MDRPRRIRGLRIAVSAVFGILCVLLVVMWVRSYSRFDLLEIRTISKSNFRVASASGVIGVMGDANPISLALTSEWKLYNVKVKNYQPMWGWYYSTRTPFGTIATVPYWFAILLCLVAIVATSPWIRLSKRFSLRTLLIATTLISVVQGLGAAYLRLRQNVRQIAQRNVRWKKAQTPTLFLFPLRAREQDPTRCDADLKVSERGQVRLSEFLATL
jgi:hypothetical protein